ncbi:MAG: hypothetical protein DWQ34_24590 [Planctomycetota bacterium]|nr:MAG: hypothetical protein DWQ34_24590 [Planctomycetota bacterium]
MNGSAVWWQQSLSASPVFSSVNVGYLLSLSFPQAQTAFGIGSNAGITSMQMLTSVQMEVRIIEITPTSLL